MPAVSPMPARSSGTARSACSSIRSSPPARAASRKRSRRAARSRSPAAATRSPRSSSSGSARTSRISRPAAARFSSSSKASACPRSRSSKSARRAADRRRRPDRTQCPPATAYNCGSLSRIEPRFQRRRRGASGAMALTLSDPKALLTRAFESALDAAAPRVCLDRALANVDERAPAVVLGAGKAAAAMAAAFSAAWEAPVRGLVVTRYGHGLAGGEDAGGIEVVEAGHPSPDHASLAAGARLLELARSVRPDEKLVGLISGGESALASAPIDSLAFEQKRDAANFLIRAGADIREINCVRKHLSGLKGGRLAAAARPANVLTFTISDVPGDDPADIASGPTIADRTTQRDALAILDGYRYPRLDELRPVLEDPRFETPKPDDPASARDTVRVVATNATALDAGQAVLEEEGVKVVRLGDDLDGEAEALGREHARLALELARGGT